MLRDKFVHKLLDSLNYLPLKSKNASSSYLFMTVMTQMFE